MHCVGKTDIGKQRKSNQDSFALDVYSPDICWAVVCDGMGGVNGGQIASTKAVEVISDKIKSSLRKNINSNAIRNLLQSALMAANITVFDISKSDDSLDGMGTTVVAVVIVDNIAHIVHVGDSRAYKISSDKKLIKITKDHSLVEEMLLSGQITEKEALNHPKRNLITRALGVAEDVEIDYNEVELDSDESLLICTDGLTSYVEPKKIENTLKKNDFNICPDKLIKLANDNGGEDNITTVIIY